MTSTNGYLPIGLNMQLNLLTVVVGDVQQAAETFNGSLDDGVQNSIDQLAQPMSILTEAVAIYQDNSPLAEQSAEADKLAGQAIIAFGQLYDGMRITLGGIFCSLPPSVQNSIPRKEVLVGFAKNRPLYQAKLQMHKQTAARFATALETVQ